MLWFKRLLHGNSTQVLQAGCRSAQGSLISRHQKHWNRARHWLSTKLVLATDPSR